MKRALPILAFLSLSFLGFATYEALFVAPTEQTMGEVQRIFYYHVPSAWTAFLLFFINFIASVQYLVRPSQFADKFVNGLVFLVGVSGCVAAFFIKPMP